MGDKFAGELFAVLPNHGELESLVKGWMKADAPNFDVGGFVVGDAPRTAHLLGKSPGVMAGRPFAQVS